MDMPKIERCRVTECCYNTDEMCHAMAITVGGPVDRKCDTFLRDSTKGGTPAIGLVGACKVASCKYNKAL